MMEHLSLNGGRYRVSSKLLKDNDNERLPQLQGDAAHLNELLDGDEHEYLAPVVDLPLSAHVPKHAAQILQSLDVFRRQQLMCDAIIYCQQREIHAHKCILSALSPVLSDAFRDDSRVEYNEYCYDAFVALVDYAYTSKLNIAAIKVAELYRTANMLKVTDVSAICAEYLALHLSPVTCIGVRRAANKHSDILLTRNVDLYIEEHMAEIMTKSTDMHALPWVQVRVIGALAEPPGHLPAKVLAALQRVHANDDIDLMVDKTHMMYYNDDDLLLHDCAEMDDNTSVGSSDIVQDYKRRSTAPSAHVASTESISSDGDEIDWTIIASLTDKSYMTCLAVIARRVCTLSIQLIDHMVVPNDAFLTRQSLLTQCVEDKRTPLTPMLQARCTHGVCVFSDDAAMVVGGYERGACLASCEMYAENKWTCVPSMTCERGRCDASMAVVDGEARIYVIGGSDGAHDLTSVEYYSVEQSDWKKLHNGDLPFARSHHNTASVDDRIYVIGGMSAAHVLKSCLVFDPYTVTWAPVADMPNEQAQCGVCVYGTSIVVAGGCDRWSVTNKVYKYDTISDTWTQLPPLSIARRGCASAIVSDHLMYVMGGNDGQTSLNTVEVMDLRTFQWTPHAGTLTVPRANAASFTIHNRVYMCGGFKGREFVDSIEMLGADGKSWQSWTD